MSDAGWEREWRDGVASALKELRADSGELRSGLATLQSATDTIGREVHSLRAQTRQEIRELYQRQNANAESLSALRGTVERMPSVKPPQNGRERQMLLGVALIALLIAAALVGAKIGGIIR